LSFLSDLLVDKRLKQLLLKTPDNPEEEAKSINAGFSDMADSEIDADAALDIVKARTLSLLRIFQEDIPRTASVLSFLGDTNLFQKMNLDLYQYNLEKANLNGANLQKANLRKADLRNADLRNADLSNADLRNALLGGANLQNANLRDANLSSAHLDKAILKGANLKAAVLSKAYLNETNFSEANLESADLSEAKLHSTDFSKANMSCTKLNGASLWGPTFQDAILFRTELSQSKGLEESQLTVSSNPPLLCATQLPSQLNNLSNRDCERLPQVLFENYPNPRYYETIEEAQSFVDIMRKAAT
jgi:hypothetical protein